MIHYFVPHRYHGHSASNFLASWGKDLNDRLCPCMYHRLFDQERLKPGVAIFTHFEGLSQPELRLARSLYRRMKRSGENFYPLNDPEKALDRYDFLLRFYEAGINNFRSYRLDDSFERMKFPVFLRLTHEHAYLDPTLYHSESELMAKIEAFRKEAPFLRAEDMIVVEFCDVAESGIYKKYSVLRIGDEMIPRHILFNPGWVSRIPSLCDEKNSEEELHFVRNFSQHEELREVFDLAGIDYGRIDYSFQKGKMRVWEINTNPVIVPTPSKIDPLRLESQTESAKQILEAFEKLDRRIPEGPPVPIWGFRDVFARRATREARKRHRNRSEQLLHLERGFPIPPDLKK